MLNPNDDRLDYGKVLSPSEDYSLDFAIGTTYSLDLDALVGACLAMGLSEETDSELMKNPICLLEALRACGDKVALFCEAGQIHVPNNVTPLYILIEKMVFQINTDKRKGITQYPSFHPKFWLLKYVDKRKQVLYKVVVLSRNLTFDRSWDITFCMYGEVKGIKTEKTAPIIDFINYLIGNSSVDDIKKKQIRSIIRELPYLHFKLNSKEFKDFEFLPTGIGGFHSIEAKAFAPLFKDSFNELLIMSPFLTGKVIKDFNDRNTKKADYMLITRAMSLDKLKPEDCSNFRIFTMKDAVVDGESAISDDTSQIQKQDIHAKLFMVSNGSYSYLYLGSLNASHNAICGNVEFMVMLKSKYLKLSELSKELFCGDEAAADNPFREVTLDNSIAADEENEKQGDLENYVKEINRMKPTAKVSEREDCYDLSISFSEYKPEPGNYRVSISPLLSKKTESLAEKVEFYSLQLAQLSEFYRVAVSDDKRTVQRVIIIPTEGLPEDREKAVINSVIKDKECFCRYIAFLLSDNYIMGTIETNYTMGGSGFGKTGNSVQMPALYEKMLKTAVSAPDKFKEIDYLLDTISADGVVPEEFEKLYNSFKKAVKF